MVDCPLTSTDAFVGRYNVSTPGYWLFSALGIGLVCTDMRTLRLPHSATGILWLTCGTLFIAESVSREHFAKLVTAAGSGVAVCALLLLVALLAPGQLGLGDVNFAGAIAFSLGWISWRAAIAAILVAFVAQWIAMKVLSIKADERSDGLALGPALYGGWLLAIAFAR
ncbi:prepilin peptidase [Dactylosporangium sp. CA-139066]|uniref:prepilin peptidase n=1 Tax=Dactylosporangium sp. CA-139066 TaxID=3239930 RepID=UPI003D8BDDE6